MKGHHRLLANSNPSKADLASCQFLHCSVSFITFLTGNAIVKGDLANTQLSLINHYLLHALLDYINTFYNADCLKVTGLMNMLKVPSIFEV